MRPHHLLPIIVSFALLGRTSRMTAQNPPTQASTNAARVTTSTRQNPLFTRSPLPFEAPPFDKIRDADYEPAIDRGMTEHLAEIDSVANQSASPTFANTIVAMERGHLLLDRATNAFYNVLSANSDDTLQRVAQTVAPKLAAHYDEIVLNNKLFHRIEALYRQRDQLALSPEEKRLLEYQYRQFVRNGALLNDADKARLRALNAEEAKLSTDFQTKLQKATTAAGLVASDRAELDGLSDVEIGAAAEAAKSRGLTGKWVLQLQNTTQQPAQQRLRNRSTRERLFIASTERAEHGDSNDTRAIVRRLAQIRAERAALLGYPNDAAYVLEEEMSKTPEARTRLLTDVASAAIRRAKGE
jgi:peptidyl-dipeptidase Dcp